MKIERGKAVAFSGHRTFKMAQADGDLFSAAKDYGPDEIAAKVRRMVAGLYAEGYTQYLCGMAEGFDLIAGRVLLSMRGECPGLEIVAAVPYPGQPGAYGGDDRELYSEILAAAAGVVTLCDRYSADCFYRRNDFLVENSSVLVAFFNGSRGGTEYTVKRALRAGCRIINLY